MFVMVPTVRGKKVFSIFVSNRVASQLVVEKSVEAGECLEKEEYVAMIGDKG